MRNLIVGIVAGVFCAASPAVAMKYTVCTEGDGEDGCVEIDTGPTTGGTTVGGSTTSGGAGNNGQGGGGSGQQGGGGGGNAPPCDKECQKKKCQDAALDKAAKCNAAADFFYNWCVTKWGMGQAVNRCKTGPASMAIGFGGIPRTKIKEAPQTCVYTPAIGTIPPKWFCKDNISLFDLPPYDDPWLRQETWPSTLGDGKFNNAWSDGYCQGGEYHAGGCLMEYYKGIPNCGGGTQTIGGGLTSGQITLNVGNGQGVSVGGSVAPSSTTFTFGADSQPGEGIGKTCQRETNLIVSNDVPSNPAQVADGKAPEGLGCNPQLAYDLKQCGK